MIRSIRSITCAACCFLLKALPQVHAVGICYWEPSVSLCVGTNDSEEGKEWAKFQVASAICIANSARDGSGCTEESGLAPSVCRNQPMTDEPGFYCLPLSADIDTVAGVREAIPPPECGSVSDEFCDMERTEYVTAMGCPQCAQPYNDAVTFYSDCLRATNAWRVSLLRFVPASESPTLTCPTTQQECQDKNPVDVDDVDDGPGDAWAPVGAPFPESTANGSAASPEGFGSPLGAPGALSPLPTESGSGSDESEIGGAGLPGTLGSIAEIADIPSTGSTDDPEAQGSTVTERLVQSQAEKSSVNSARGTLEGMQALSSGSLVASIVALALALAA